MLAATDEYRRPIKSVYRFGIPACLTLSMPIIYAPASSLWPEWQPLSDEAKVYQRFYKTVPRARCLARHGPFEVDGYELVSHCWWPEKVKGTLFLLHGLRSHRAVSACHRVGTGSGFCCYRLRLAGAWSVEWAAGEHP
jgi:hypothetical protein